VNPVEGDERSASVDGARKLGELIDASLPIPTRSGDIFKLWLLVIPVMSVSGTDFTTPSHCCWKEESTKALERPLRASHDFLSSIWTCVLLGTPWIYGIYS